MKNPHVTMVIIRMKKDMIIPPMTFLTPCPVINGISISLNMNKVFSLQAESKIAINMNKIRVHTTAMKTTTIDV